MYMHELQTRLDQLKQQIPQVKNRQARRELTMMLQSANSAITKVDQESVECRRLQKQTIKYQELINEADRVLKFVEQHLVFAVLLNG
jgi:guanyl-specific ribonuclease Sa